MKLKDKVSIVTGAGSGIGRAICIQMAKEGAKVVAADIKMQSCEETIQILRKFDSEGLALKVDVTDKTSIENMIDTTVERYGCIDILCNNAGIGGDAIPAVEATEETWDQVINVNLKSVFMISRRVIPVMLKKGKGVIVNIASASGHIASPAGCDYTASKHGIIGLTKQLSYEYGSKGIQINAVSPGVIETPLTKSVALPNGPFHNLTMGAPAGRYGKPEEVAKVVSFLSSEDATFIHGSVVNVDGGSTIY